MDVEYTELKYTRTDHVMKNGGKTMNGKRLARMIKKMTNQELYAFVTASVLELERRSEADDVEVIMTSIYKVIKMLRPEGEKC